jgi:uncharacterized membrane protein
MNQNVRELASRLLHSGYTDLAKREQRILDRMAKRLAITEDVNERFHSELTFPQRLADNVAAFGGSWSFIILFGVVLAAWVLLNVWVLSSSEVFDPYPFVFLNLILSMLAAIQAPVIMMSQNRQTSKDRLVAANDYEVNLKAELEIMHLHEKVDDLRIRQFDLLMQQQSEQINHLKTLLEKVGK